MNHEGTKTRSLRVASTIEPDLEAVATAIVDSAYQVHSTFGPGLLESVYAACLRRELTVRGYTVHAEQSVPVVYRGMPLDLGFRLDLIVENRCIIEVKAVEGLLAVHRAQLLTYMKLTGTRLGFLINFNVPVIKDGIKRVVL